jgi:hypothetical protein
MEGVSFHEHLLREILSAFLEIFLGRVRIPLYAYAMKSEQEGREREHQY